MALIQLGGGILDARGSIGGQVFSKNRFGNYLRARITPVNPKSDRQNVIRAAIQDLSQRWSSTLTPLQRSQWAVYAAAIVRQNKLGAQIKLTGFNQYIRSNSIRLQQGDNTVGDGPGLLTLPPGDPTFACTVDEAAQQISVVFDATMNWAKQDLGHMYVAMSIPKATGTNFIGGPFRIAAKLTGIDPGGLASPQVMAVPFPVIEGQEVACRGRISEEDGRLSDFFRDQSSVTA